MTVEQLIQRLSQLPRAGKVEFVTKLGLDGLRVRFGTAVYRIDGEGWRVRSRHDKMDHALPALRPIAALLALLLAAAAVSAQDNPNNPNEPAYVKAERAALLKAFPVEAFPVRAIKSGMWHEPETWSTGKVPTPTDDVYIPPNTTVGTDGDVDCNDVRIDGVWRFARDRDMTIKTKTVVGPLCASTLDAGTQADPITAKCEVVFRAKAVDISEDPREFGTGYVGHRTLVWGTSKTTQVDYAGAAAGATSVTLTAVPVGWAAGDTIVLAGTGGKPGEPYRFNTEEKVTITGVNGAVVSFTPPLQYTHSATFAINLTRNITFRSENAGYGNTIKPRWPSDEFTLPDPVVKQRGHFMVMGCGVGNSEVGYAAFNDLGRTDKRTHLDAVKFKDGKRLETLNGRPSGTNQVGRYAVHFHQGGRLGNPALCKGVAVNGSPGWGFTNHSSNVNFLDCVSYDFIGAGFAWEIGDETGTIENCAAIGGRGGFANRDGVVNSAAFDREQGTNGAGFWSQTAGRVKYRTLRSANCVSGFNFWAGPGTQVYSANPNRVSDNIFGSIDPADIDPAGPDAYLLAWIDPTTGTINPIRSRLDLDGGSFSQSFEGDFLLGPVTTGPTSPNTIRNLKAGGINAQYTLYTVIEEANLSAGPKLQSPYVKAFLFSGTDNSSVVLRKSTLHNWGVGITIPMGLSEVSDCTLSNGVDIEVPAATLVNISKHPQRPRELYVDRNTSKNKLLAWAGVNVHQNPFIAGRIVVDGKQLYAPQSEPDYVPYPTVDPIYTPAYFAGKTNAQLLSEFGQCVNGDVTPADAVYDARFGYKVGTPSKRLSVVCRPDGYQNTLINRPSGKIAKLPVEIFPLKQHLPVIVNVDHPVKPGWQTVLVDFEGQRYGVNVFGTGSTPPPEPPVPPPLVVTTVEVTPANITLEVGKTAQLSSVVKDQFGAVMPGKVVVWSTTDNAVAVVSPTGLVSAKAAGNCVLSATVDPKVGTTNVTVTSPPPPKPKVVKVTIELDNGTKVEFP